MEECKVRARDAGLVFENETLEYIVTNKDMIELSPKGMIPTMYDYWVHDVEILKEKGLDITFIKTLETSVRKMGRLDKELDALKERVNAKKELFQQEKELTFNLVKEAQKVLKKEVGKEEKPEKEPKPDKEKKSKKKEKKQNPEIIENPEIVENPEIIEKTEIAEEPK